MVRDLPNEMLGRDEKEVKTLFLDLRLDLVDLGLNTVKTQLALL